jgi:aminoglycoside phosphotransferase (APT) family kinase protein
MGREFGILSRLSPHYPAAPRPLAYCDDVEVLGAPFYLMNRVTGVILRGTPPEGLDVSPTLARDCCEAFVKGLANLHALDFNAMGLKEFHRPGHYVARQVNGWAERYQNSRTDDIPDIENAFRWLAERIPPDSDTVLIHGDYKFDNLLLDPADLTRIIGVLDWEMSTIGDPLMDLGGSLSYWADADDRDELKTMQCFLTSLPGAYNRQQVADRYGELTGRDTSNILFYYVFGVLKLAVIMQQIYYRFKAGTTRDERFGMLILFIYLMGQIAARAIETGKISS